MKPSEAEQSGGWRDRWAGGDVDGHSVGSRPFCCPGIVVLFKKGSFESPCSRLMRWISVKKGRRGSWVWLADQKNTEGQIVMDPS